MTQKSVDRLPRVLRNNECLVDLTVETIMELLKCCLVNFPKQIQDGVLPIGSPLSSIISNIDMEYVIKRRYKRLKL